jgi:uncharacterized protein
VKAWLGLVLVLALALSACTQSVADGSRVDDQLPLLFPEGPRPEAHDYVIDGRKIHYLLMPGGPARIIFLHGTPGNWQGWSEFLADPRLRELATMIAVDRPGFGNSGRGHMVPQLDDQVRLLAPLLEIEGGGQDHSAVLVGHSLGGPIAARMAMEHSAQVRAALLIAPSIDPATERPRWFNQLADTWLARAFAGTWIQHQFADDDLYNANAEIMPLARNLKAMEPDWSRVTMPVTVLQGMKDTLVNPATADYAERVLPKGNASVLRLPNEDHFVLWREPRLVVEAIVDLLNRSANAANGAAGVSGS